MESSENEMEKVWKKYLFQVSKGKERMEKGWRNSCEESYGRYKITIESGCGEFY